METKAQQRKQAIQKLKEQLRTSLMREFTENGLHENDELSRDTWFLKDLLKMYGDGQKGATLTPNDNINLQAQIFLQLQRNGAVTVKQYVEELTIVLIENFMIISNWKQIHLKGKSEKHALQQLLDKIQNKLVPNNVQESRIGIKVVKSSIPDSFFDNGEAYTLDAKVDQDTSTPLCDIKMNDVEESDFKFVHFLFSNDNLMFGLRDQKKKSKQIAVAQIDLKKLFESLTILQLQDPKGTQIQYSIQFYEKLDQVENSEYDPQSNKSDYLFKIDLKMHITFELHDLRDIAQYKQEYIKRSEAEFRYRKDRHVALIDDALFPFAHVKYSFEKGFYSRDNKDAFGENGSIAGEEEGGHIEKCRVCETCLIF